MNIGGLTLDGNVLEIAWAAAMIAVLVAAFLIGKMTASNRLGAGQDSIDALMRVRAEEEVRLDALRREKEGVLKAAQQAESELERWEAVKRNHEQLDEMRRELDEFAREKSKRIEDLERQRSEAAQHLREIQSALDRYPPEITGDDGVWNQMMVERRDALDQLRQDADLAERELEKADARRTQAGDEAARLERKSSQLDGEIEDAQAQLERIEKGQIDKLKPYNERLLGEARQLQGQIASLNAELIDKKDTLDKIRDASKRRDIEKLGAFRSMPECLSGYEEAHPDTDEDALLSEFEDALRDHGLQYPTRIIRAFHTALKVNDLSPLTVLSGLSGTGKSQLPRAYARFFGIHFLHVPVEPGWDSPQDLLGFYDFVAERYRPTDRARALGHFDSRFAQDIGIENDPDWGQRILIILLDEMNLARTEYYFSEFLSRLEMRGPRRSNGGDEDSRRDAQIAIDLPYAEGERPKHLYVPHNVLWVGTLNEDETTQALSDKVLDRANSIRFAPPAPGSLREHRIAPERSVRAANGYLPYQQWLGWSERNTTDGAGSDQINETIEELANLMQKAGRGFGYRIVQSINTYIGRYPGQDWRVPMIDQINMRLLPKLSGTEMSDCQETVDGLRRLCDDTLGDPAFATALQNAETASQASQIFTWPGYTYEA